MVTSAMQSSSTLAEALVLDNTDDISESVGKTTLQTEDDETTPKPNYAPRPFYIHQNPSRPHPSLTRLPLRRSTLQDSAYKVSLPYIPGLRRRIKFTPRYRVHEQALRVPRRNIHDPCVRYAPKTICSGPNFRLKFNYTPKDDVLHRKGNLRVKGSALRWVLRYKFPPCLFPHGHPKYCSQSGTVCEHSRWVWLGMVKNLES